MTTRYLDTLDTYEIYPLVTLHMHAHLALAVVS